MSVKENKRDPLAAQRLDYAMRQLIIRLLAAKPSQDLRISSEGGKAARRKNRAETLINELVDDWSCSREMIVKLLCCATIDATINPHPSDRKLAQLSSAMRSLAKEIAKVESTGCMKLDDDERYLEWQQKRDKLFKGPLWQVVFTALLERADHYDAHVLKGHSLRADKVARVQKLLIGLYIYRYTFLKDHSHAVRLLNCLAIPGKANKYAVDSSQYRREMTQFLQECPLSRNYLFGWFSMSCGKALVADRDRKSSS